MFLKKYNYVMVMTIDYDVMGRRQGHETNNAFEWDFYFLNWIRIWTGVNVSFEEGSSSLST